jgi:NAD(P)-dependent dehydrogenase (short-subunit alcohol dehydrogenase family)
MGILDGKVALVTGAGQGIGRGIARRFAREGAVVVIAEISEEHGQRVQAEVAALGGRGQFVHTDVSKKSDIEAAIKAAVAQFGRLDVLVNNAIKLPTPVLMEKKTDAMLEQQLAIGVWGTWWGMQAAIPLGRMGDPEEDIAPAAVFLASELSCYITGATIPVDGGLNLPRINQTPAELLKAGG